jgi:hypothetical protein
MVRRVLLLVILLLGCKKHGPRHDDWAASLPSATTVPPPGTVPPVATAVAPVSAFAEAPVAADSEGTPLDRARSYEANGQLWLARLTIEKRALAANATSEETALLARVCVAQGDRDCVAGCERKLGKKIPFDAGPPDR